MKSPLIALIVTGALYCPATAYSADDRGTTYTLYRDSTLIENMRVHWATFDANMPGTYNQDHCEQVASLLAVQPDSPANRYWCEAGRYREIKGTNNGRRNSN